MRQDEVRLNLFGLAVKHIDGRTSWLKNCFCGTFFFINVRAKSGLNVRRLKKLEDEELDA